MNDRARWRMLWIATIVALLAAGVVTLGVLVVQNQHKIGSLDDSNKALKKASAAQQARIDQLTGTLKDHHIPVPPVTVQPAPGQTVIIEPQPGHTVVKSGAPHLAPTPGDSPHETPPPRTPSPHSTLLCIPGLACPQVSPVVKGSVIGPHPSALGLETPVPVVSVLTRR